MHIYYHSFLLLSFSICRFIPYKHHTDHDRCLGAKIVTANGGESYYLPNLDLLAENGACFSTAIHNRYIRLLVFR